MDELNQDNFLDNGNGPKPKKKGYNPLEGLKKAQAISQSKTPKVSTPKKTYSKPGSQPVKESQVNTTISGPEDQILSGYNLTHSTLPKTTASIAAYNWGSAVNAIASIKSNIENKPLREKNLADTNTRKTGTTVTNNKLDQKYYDDNVKAYYNTVKKAKGDNGEGFFTRLWNKTDLLANTLVTQAIDYAGIQLGHALDIPDMMQSISLPDHYDLKNLEVTLKQLGNEFSTFDKKITSNLMKSIGVIDDKTNSKNNKIFDETYAKNSSQYAKEKLDSKKKYETSLKNGTLEAEKQAFYSSLSPALGAINRGLKGVNKTGSWIDDKIFNDKDNGENWFSNMYYDQLDRDNLIRKQAQSIYDGEQKDKEFQKRSAILAEQIKNDPDKLAKAVEAESKKIYGKKRSDSFFSENWDSNTKSFWDKLTDSNSYEGVEDIIDFDNKFMPMLGQTIGTLVATELTLGSYGILGSVGKTGIKGLSTVAQEAKLTKAISASKPVKSFTEFTSKFKLPSGTLKGMESIKDNLKALPYSYSMAYDESRQIGHDVYEKAVEDKLVKATGISKELFYKQFSPEDGKDFSPQELANMDKAYEKEVVEKFSKENPDAFKKIIKTANDAAELATSTNLLPETLGKVLMFSKFLNTKKVLSRSTQRILPFLEKPMQSPLYKWTAQGVKTSIVEGILEEASINLIAQRKGEYFAEGKYYGIDDYIKEVGSKEYMDNLAGGLLMGNIQSAGMSIGSRSFLQDIKDYKDYKKVIRDYKELSKYTGQDELSKFLSNNLEAVNAETYAAKNKEFDTKLAQLESQKKKSKGEAKKNIQSQIEELKDSFNRENNRFTVNRISNALQTGTTHKLISTLEGLTKEENISDVDKTEILDTIDTIKKVEGVYNEHIDKADAGKIISNRFSNIVNTKNLQKIDLELSQLQIKKNEVLSRIARQNAREESRIFKAKPVEGSKDIAQWRTTSQAFKDRVESHLNDLKETFSQGNDLGDPELRKINQLQESRDLLEDAIDNNEVEFQNLISEEYQEKVIPKGDFYRDITKVYGDSNLKEEDRNKQIKRLYKRYSDVLDTKELNAVENEVKTKVDNQRLIEEELQTQLKKAQDAKIFEEQKKAQEKSKQAQKEITESQKKETPISEESKIVSEKLVPNRSIPENQVSEETYQQEEQERFELSNKEDITPDEQIRLNELEDRTSAESSRRELDTLLGESENIPSAELTSSEADFLSSMGLDPSVVKNAPTFRSESISVKEGENISRAINLEDEDENYSPNTIREGSDFENPFKNFIADLIFQVARNNNIQESDVKAEDVLDRLISIAGKDKAEKAWNIFEQGYRLNRPDSSVNFERLYDLYFTDSVVVLDNLLDKYTIPEDTTQEIEETKKEVPAVQTTTESKPVFDENNKPVVSLVTEPVTIEDMISENPVVEIRTNNPNAPKTHLVLGKNYLLGILPRLFKNKSSVFESNTYKELYIGNLFKLENFKKHKSNKLPMSLRIPEDYMNHIIKGDKAQGYKMMPFSEWVQATGAIEGSEEWINKLPIIAHYEGQPTFYLNDAMASTSMNIIERDPNDTSDIAQAKKAYFTYVNNNIRQRVYEQGSQNIEVKVNQVDLAEKTASTGLPIGTFSKDILIGTWDSKSQIFKIFGKPFQTSNNIFSYFNRNNNSNVVIKPTGIVDENGNPEYQAFQFETNGLLNKNHTTSLMAALYSYLGREVKDLLPSGVKNFRDTLKTKSNIDLENYVDLNNYINSISRTSYFAEEAKRLGLSERDNSGLNVETKIKQAFARFINDKRNKAQPGQPQIAIVDYKVVFAITPENNTLMDPDNVVVVDPLNITSKEQLDEAAKLVMNPYFTALNKTSTSINISHRLLPNNNPYYLINSSNPNELIQYDSYDQYARNFIKVGESVSVRQVENPDGTKQDIYNRYAVLEITEPNGFPKSFEEFIGEKESVQEVKNQKEEAKAILEETKPSQEISNEEVENLVEEIKQLRQVISDLRSMDIPTKEMEDSLDILTNKYKDLTGETLENFSPNIISETQVQEMMSKEQENFKDIEGLSLYQRQDLTNYIFNQIAGTIGYQKGSKISKKHILGDIKNKLEGILKQNIDKNTKNIEIIKKFTPNNISTIQELENKNKVFNSIIDNYNILEEDVLELLEEKVGIKDVKDKTIGDNIQDSVIEETSELNEDEDPTENIEEDLTEGNDIDKDLVERDKSFNSSSLEVKGKATVSAKMKRFLARIPIVNRSGNVEKGFLDLERYYDFKDLDNEIKVALNTPKEIDSDYNTVIAKLQSIKDQYSWAEPLLKRLQDPKTPEQARIEFMYNYTGRHSINTKFVEFEMLPNGKFVTNILDANYTDIAKNIRKDWADNLKTNSTLYDATEDGSYRINPDKAERLLEVFNNIYKQLGNTKSLPLALNNVSNNLATIKLFNQLQPGQSLVVNQKEIPTNAYRDFNRQLESNSKLLFKVNNKNLIEVTKDYDGNIIYTKPILSENLIENLADWANAVGINLNASTLTDLAYDGLDLGKRGVVNFYSLLDYDNLNSPFSEIARNLAKVKTRQKLGYSLDIKDFNIYEGAGDKLLALAKIESRYTNKVITKNFRDNGKLMQGLPIGKYATDRVKDLTDPDSGILDTLSKLSFSKNSVIGKLLRDPEFASRFKLSHTANGSFKQKDNKFDKNAKVTDLTALDLELAKLGFFFETNNVSRYNQTILEDFSGDSDTRMGNVFLPTMSDKDQMMTIETLIFNINEFNYSEGQLNDSMLELLYSQLVKPDLERIHSFHSKVQGKTDIKGYDEAAQLFNLLPSLNSLVDTNGDTVTQLIKRDPVTYNINYIEQTYKEQFKQEINSLINHLVEEKVNTWKTLEVIDSKNNIRVNENYLATRKEKNNKELLNKNIAAEFVINNLITNANMHMLVIGDPALYSQSKFFNSNRFKNGDPTIPKYPGVYREWSETSLGINLGKRLALMLAPGNKLYNSKGDVYHQVYLKDFVDISSNIVDLIGDFYGQEAKNNAKVEVDRIREINSILSNQELEDSTIQNLRDERSASIESLKETYGKLADYFDIEATDAQEYTTVSEHINVMRRQGRIDDELFTTIETKLKGQQEEALKGLPISQTNYLTKKELGLVLQPIKPVHTGQIFDKDQDVARTVYVKSSSFPLIPQLTYGKPIDGVRRVLEEYEAKVNKNSKEGDLPIRVRASYDTANKVGATKNALSIFNLDGSFNKEFSVNNIENAKLELNRNNFRIQQDVPYKSDKGKEDRISYGTQMLKVLFSNGVLDVKSGFLNPNWDREDMDNNEGKNKEISGKELFDEYNNAFIDLVNSKKEQLYRELGVNKDGFVQDENKFKQNISKLLNKEGKKRDYSKNDLNSLRLTEDNKFVLPLFLNNQSTKIESLLLSIISSRVVKHKFPGYSYVAGSEAGFKLNKSEDYKGVVGADRIIYTSDFTGELKGTIHKGTGEIQFAEVMVPSKIRDNQGNMLDLYEKDNSESGYKYLTVEEGSNRFILKNNSDGKPMIQEHLLNLVTFRIPTSSHVSLSNVKVVGILPPESGDLIIVPKNFTKQKGLDFDVDKENTYHLWTYVNPSGRVKELSKGYIDYLADKMEKRKARGLNNLKNEDSEYYQELISALGSEENVQEFIDNKEKSLDEKIEDFKLAMNQKLIENKIIKIHTSVLGNPNTAVQNKINKILSMDFAKEQAENISMLKELGRKNNFINSNIDSDNTREQVEQDYEANNKYFTILSDEYQSYKMFLGSAGKSGIGVYSNFLTMSSLMQQYGNLGDFRLMEYNPYEKSYNNLNITINGIGTIDGVLGRISTIDGSRSISEVFEELQNTATDNEKEQIMGRTGINNHTISVFSIMSMLGIDKTPVSNEVIKNYNLGISNNQMSFGNLLLSQNIVSKIVQKLEYNNSNVTEFDNKQVIDIIKDIKKELEPSRPYAEEGETLYNEEGEPISSNTVGDYDLLTGDNLVKAIAGETLEFHQDFEFQILDLLERLYSFQTQFRNAQKVLNISSNGLGLDLVEANNYNQLLAKITNTDPKNNMISGLDKLLFKRVSETGKISDRDKETKLFINEFYGELVPTTPIGASILNSFSMNKRLYGDLFPYQSREYRDAIGLALQSTKITGNGQAKLNFERKFAKELKKYLFSNSNLFEGTTRSQRERLFFDSKDNTSLANYIKSLSDPQNEVSEYVSQRVLNNPLIKKFLFDVNLNSAKNIKSRMPSTIKYNDSNSIVENRDVLYRALPELIASDIPLLPYNGEPYSTRALARDLISYAFLEGGVQEIQQFVKYVPISYLEVIGFTREMINKYENLNDTLSIRNSEGITTPSFIRQFFQHNPELATRIRTFDNGVTYEVLKKNKVFNAITDSEFTLNQETQASLRINNNRFVSVYDGTSKSKNKYILFERDPNDNNRFVKRPTAGFFGLSEYDSSRKLIRPLKEVDTNLPDKPSNLPNNSKTIVTSSLGIGELSTLEVVDNLIGLNNEFSKIIEPFRNFLPKGLEIYFDNTLGANGVYSPTKNIIRLNPKLEENPLALSNILVKELIHSATTNYVSNYLNGDGSLKSSVEIKDVPLPIRKLKVLYEELLKGGQNLKNPNTKQSLIDYVKEYNQLKLEGRGQSIREDNLNFYGFVDIFEFIEMGMTSPEFRNFLDSISDKVSKERGVGFLDRLKDIFKSLWTDLTNKTVSKEVVNTISEVILSNRNNLTMDTDIGDNLSPLESLTNTLKEAKNLLDNNISSKFAELDEDPFLC